MRALFVACVFLAGCAARPDPPDAGVQLGEEFQLQLGRNISLADSPYFILFDEVLEDSRCARGNTCVWEGNARVQFTLREVAPLTRRSLEVLDHGIELNTHPGQPRQVQFGQYVIELRGLEPYPVAGTQNGSPPSYVATLLVSRPVTPPATQGP